MHKKECRWPYVLDIKLLEPELDLSFDGISRLACLLQVGWL
jgi:hypothetical protein